MDLKELSIGEKYIAPGIGHGDHTIFSLDEIKKFRGDYIVVLGFDMIGFKSYDTPPYDIPMSLTVYLDQFLAHAELVNEGEIRFHKSQELADYLKILDNAIAEQKGIRILTYKLPDGVVPDESGVLPGGGIIIAR